MQYRVDTDAVEQVAGQVQQKHQDILGTIAELRSLNSTLDDSWDGEAQRAFETTFGDWLQELEQFSNTLEAVQQFLTRYVADRLELDSTYSGAASGVG